MIGQQVAWRTIEVVVHQIIITLLLFPLTQALLETKASLRYSTHIQPLSTSSLTLVIANNWVWDTKLQKDIQTTGPLSIVETFTGITLRVTLGRFIINSLCEKHICPYCNGKKTVDKSKNENKLLDVNQSISLPCPRCLGLGFTLQPPNCPLYQQVQEEVAIVVPPGARAEQTVTVKGKGNEIYHNSEPVLGDLLYVVEKITFDNHSDFEFDSFGILHYKVKVTPHEALHGFNLSKSFINGQSLVIRRPNKVTLPGTAIRLPGMGFPKFNASISSSSADSTNNSEGIESIEGPASSDNSNDKDDSENGVDEGMSGDGADSARRRRSSNVDPDRTLLYDDLVVEFWTYSELELTRNFLNQWVCEGDENKFDKEEEEEDKEEEEEEKEEKRGMMRTGSRTRSVIRSDAPSTSTVKKPTTKRASRITSFGRGPAGGGTCPVLFSSLDLYQQSINTYAGTCGNSVATPIILETASATTAENAKKKKKEIACALKKTEELAIALRQNRVAETLLEELHILSMFNEQTGQ